MIAKLHGTVDTLLKDGCILMVSGVGYRVYCSRLTLSRLAPGAHAALMVETLIRQDSWQLFAFSSEEEQEWFRLLTTIPGVGPKVALALQSVLSPDEMTLAIASGDKVMITRADGVGPKLASRIVSEMKDKIGAFGLSLGPTTALADGTPQPSATPKAFQEALSALTHLGYPQSLAFEALSHVTQTHGDLPLNTLIQKALQHLGRTGAAT